MAMRIKRSVKSQMTLEEQTHSANNRRRRLSSRELKALAAEASGWEAMGREKMAPRKKVGPRGPVVPPPLFSRRRHSVPVRRAIRKESARPGEET